MPVTVRAVLVTGEEPLYLPGYVARILGAHAEAFEAVAVVPPARSRRAQVRRQFRAWGPGGFLRLGARFAAGRLLGALPPRVQRAVSGRPHSLRAVAREHDLPVRRVPDAGADGFADWVRARDPDLLLSVIAGQLLPGDVLGAADLAVNLHGSLLPAYRGRATAFWPLYHGDDESGVTAHLMTDEWDAGPILRQRSFSIESGDTMHDLNRKIAATGGALAADLLADLRAGQEPEPQPNPTTEADYHTLPTPAERREFRRRGNRFV